MNCALAAGTPCRWQAAAQRDGEDGDPKRRVVTFNMYWQQ